MTLARTKRSLVAAVLVILSTAAGIAAGYGVAGSVVDGWFQDRALQLRSLQLKVLGRSGGTAAPPRVAVVGLDAATMAEDAFRGIPRPLMGQRFADVAAIALDAGAVVVGLDVILSFSPDDYVDPATGERPLQGGDRGLLRFLYDNRGGVIVAQSAAVAPHRRVLAAVGADGVKRTVMRPDADGVIRRHVLAEDLAGSDHFIDALLARAIDGGRARDPTAAGVGEGATYRPLPDAKLQAALPYMSMAAVLACAETEAGRDHLAAFFGGRVVIVGNVAANEDEHPYSDRFLGADRSRVDAECGSAPPPARRPVPGAFILADFVNAPLAGTIATPADGRVVAGVLIVFALGATVFGLLARPALYPAFMMIAIAAFATPLAFLEIGADFPAASPLAVSLVAFAVMALGRNALLMRHERRLRELFGYYLAPQVIEEMARSSELPALSGERRHVVVGFIDIVRYTAFAESHGDVETVSMVNACFDSVCDILTERGAYIDKFIGDAVLAVWNAPNPVDAPEERAVEAALAVIDALPAIRTGASHPGLSLRIALHAGEALVGTIGGSRKRSYTVMGTTVNVASRLEEVAKAEGMPLVISEAVYRALADKTPFGPVWRGPLRGLEGTFVAFGPEPGAA